MFPLLEENCGYNETEVPQLQRVSDFLKSTKLLLLLSDLIST